MQAGLKMSIMCKHIDLHASFACSITIYKLFLKPSPQTKKTPTATNEQPFTLDLSSSGYSHAGYSLPMKEQKKAGSGLLNVKQTGPKISEKLLCLFVFCFLFHSHQHGP